MHGLLQEPPEEHLSLSILSFQNVYDGICKGVRKGGLGLKPPLSLIFYENFITCAKEIFAYFLLVNLST